MPVRFRNRVFAPGVFGTLLTLLLLAGLINLGLWQLRRADEKHAMLAAFASGQATTVEFSTANTGIVPRYQRVTAVGSYESGRQVLLDNMPSKNGAPGYHVLTPLRLNDGALVLVDRGWVPLGPDRAALPEIGVDGERRQITAMVDELPRPGIRLGQPDSAPGHWPRVANFPEFGDLARVYGDQLLRPILLLDATADSGFERVWEKRLGFGPERHVGYAIQWFALSAALLAIYFVVNLRSPAHDLK